MTVTVAPATLVELASLAGVVSRLHWRVARECFAKGDVFAFRAEDELIAVGGFYPIDDADAEAWFCPCRADDPENRLARPAARASALVRAIRLTIRQSPYRAIVAVCNRRSGARIARACGFRFKTSIEQGEVWVYGGTDGVAAGDHGGSDRRNGNLQRDQG